MELAACCPTPFLVFPLRLFQLGLKIPSQWERCLFLQTSSRWQCWTEYVGKGLEKLIGGLSSIVFFKWFCSLFPSHILGYPVSICWAGAVCYLRSDRSTGEAGGVGAQGLFLSIWCIIFFKAIWFCLDDLEAISLVQSSLSLLFRLLNEAFDDNWEFTVSIGITALNLPISNSRWF